MLKSLAFDPDQKPFLAMDSLALGYIKQEQYAEAVALLERAIRKAGDDEEQLKVLNDRMQQCQRGIECKIAKLVTKVNLKSDYKRMFPGSEKANDADLQAPVGSVSRLQPWPGLLR